MTIIRYWYVVLALALTTFAASAQAGEADIRFAYVANANDETISIYAVVEGIHLVPRGYMPLPIDGDERGHVRLPATPDGRRLFALDSRNSALKIFSIDAATGMLDFLSQAKTEREPIAIAVHPNGRTVVLVHQSGDVTTLDVAPQWPDGAVTVSRQQAGPKPVGLALDATGDFAYVLKQGSAGAGSISGYRIDAGGVLSPITMRRGMNLSLPAKTYPLGIAVSPDGKTVAVANAYSKDIFLLAKETDGSLRLGKAFPVAHLGMRHSPSSVTFDQTGRHLAVSYGWERAYMPASSFAHVVDIMPMSGFVTYDVTFDRRLVYKAGTVTLERPCCLTSAASAPGARTFAVAGGKDEITTHLWHGPSGMVAPVIGPPETGNPLGLLGRTWTRSRPVSVAFAKGPSFKLRTPTIYLTYHADSRLEEYESRTAIFAVDPRSGELQPRVSVVGPKGAGIYGGNNFATSWKGMTVDPWGKFAYLPHPDSGRITTYKIDPATGGLDMVGTLEVVHGGQPNGMAIDMRRRFAFVTNVVAKTVTTYGIDPGTGLLSAIPEITTAAVPGHAGPVVIDPSGRFVYVLTVNVQGLNAIIQYRVGSNGQLTQMGAIPDIAINHQTTAFKMDPSGRYIYLASSHAPYVRAFDINPEDGSLSESMAENAGYNFSADNFGMAVDLSGRSMYVPNWGEQSLSPYLLESDGSVRKAAQSPVPFSGKGNSVGIDALGKRLFVSADNMREVHIFEIGWDSVPRLQSTAALNTAWGSLTVPAIFE